jgi:Ca2+-binding RTX toxin-like protein
MPAASAGTVLAKEPHRGQQQRGGDDDLFGGSGTLVGNGVANIIRGNDGDDTLRGGGGNDFLSGNAGRDRLFGEAGDDQLFARDSVADLVLDGSGFDKAQLDNIEPRISIESLPA